MSVFNKFWLPFPPETQNQKIIFVPFSTPSMLLCVIRFLVPARAYLGLWPLNSFPFSGF